jgi:hypothetical protein
MMVYQLFVGIDIAARSFTSSWTQDRRSFSPAQTFTQDPDGFARLERQLTTTGIAPAETLLVLEATSSYWVALTVHLHAAGYRVAVVNPMHLRNYARSLSRRAKTDALDAHLVLPCTVRLLNVGLPFTLNTPPRLTGKLPSAFPAVILNPSSSALLFVPLPFAKGIRLRGV